MVAVHLPVPGPGRDLVRHAGGRVVMHEIPLSEKEARVRNARAAPPQPLKRINSTPSQIQAAMKASPPSGVSAPKA